MFDNFQLIRTPIDQLVIIQPKAYGDQRGFFMETYSKPKFVEMGIELEFVQFNHSCSSKGVLRGIHFQKKYPQGKLVRVVKGSAYDVAVDLRKDSPTLGQWYGLVLSEENQTMFYIPPGFGHGFYAIEDDTHFIYGVTDIYRPGDEGGIRFDDSTLAIQWPIDDNQLIISNKDLQWGSYEQFINMTITPDK